MPETVTPDPEDVTDTDAEPDEEVAKQSDSEEPEEQEFYIPAPGGLRGL